MNDVIGICLLSLINIQIINSLSSSSSSYLFASATSQYQPVVNIAFGEENHTETYRPIQPITSGWTPVITKNANQQQSNSVYTAINPSSSASAVVTKVIPLVAPLEKDQQGSTSTINITSQYITSESIARSSFQKPQNTYMIHPTKYQQAFSSKSPLSTDRNAKISSSKSNVSRKSSSINKGNKIINSEVMPIPMIKPHRHGATLGFNLPDQGLTLYLDINELATKPMAQNIGLKVVSHNKKGPQLTGDDEEQNENFVKVNAFNTNNMTSINQKLIKSSSENNAKINFQQKKLEHLPKKIVVKKAKFRYKVAKNKTMKVIKSKKSNSSNGHSNIMSPIQANNAKLVITSRQEITNNHHFPSSFSSNRLKTMVNNRSDIPPSASRIPTTFTSQTQLTDEYEIEMDKNNAFQQKKEPMKDNHENKEKEIPNDKIEREIITISSEDENNDDIDDDEEGDIENVELPLNFDPNDEDEEENEHNENVVSITTEIPVETTTNNYWSSREKNSNYVLNEDLATNGNTLEENVKKQESIDNELVSQMQTLLEKSAKLFDLSAAACAARNIFIRNVCSTRFSSITSNTSTTIREIAQQLDANLILNEIPSLFESELQDFMDFSTSGYTIILPSNGAVGRLPPNLLKRWKQNIEGFTLNAYLIEGTHTIESLLARRLISTRNKMKLFINNPFNETYTINGQRVIYANQKAPNNGLVHIIDGLFFPSSDKDIISTLKSCGRFDGFVTLAEGTRFAETLKKDGPFTVFVPSNDALQKVPDNDLEVIRRNMTALKEFLMYHVAQGIYYSQDLMDGQFLPSILEGQFLQTGIRVDGCSRRLVEVNVSPLYRADIPASNGVIHVVDWILKPDDRDWCNGIILPRRR